MPYKTFLFTILLSLLATLTSCSTSSSQENELTVSAAASLTDAIKELVDIYEDNHDVSIKLNLASSGKLAQQIEQGAPVDLFLSANQSWMDQLQKKDLIEPESRINFASNKIVIIGPEQAPTRSIEDLEGLSRSTQLAVGDPESVPAGTYTKQALETIHLWSELQNRMVFASDVRQVLAYVESGNAAYGFVYASDAKISNQVTIIDEFDTNWHDPIIYPGAVTTNSANQSIAKSFLNFLKTEEAQEVLQTYGFQN